MGIEIIQAGPESFLFVRLLVCASRFDSSGVKWFKSYKHVGKPMNEQQPEQIMAETIARLTAKVEQLREFIRTYTAIECRGQTYYPEWAERALRE